MEAGRMASSMAPKSDVRTNTGGDEMMTMARLAEDMPMEDDMEEDEELDIVETPIRRMNEGGLAGMSGGGRGMFTDPNFNPSMGLFPTRVRPRPAEAQGQGLLGSMGFDPNKFQRTDWDAQFGKYYNADGTLKDEFKQNVASTAMNTDDQPDSVRDAQRMMDINEIPEPPKKDDDEKPPPGTDDPAPRDYLSDLTASLDKMREAQKEQMEKNQALGIMLEGINLYKDRGVPGEKAGEGLKTMALQDAKVQDRLAQLEGLGAKIAIAEANIAQKDRAVEAAIKKAAAKTGLSAKDALARYTQLSSDIITLKTKLRTDDVIMTDAERESLLEDLKEMEDVRDILQGQAKGLMGDNILDTDLRKYLKELYKNTSPNKEDE
jgi:hypothetical protein